MAILGELVEEPSNASTLRRRTGLCTGATAAAARETCPGFQRPLRRGPGFHIGSIPVSAQRSPKVLRQSVGCWIATVPVVPEHPIAALRRRLAAEFSTDLPAGVHPVARFCAEPQFFPGATGLLSASTWRVVTPGVEDPVVDPGPGDPTVEVMVIGNYQATRASYERILAGEIGGFPTTWRRLRLLLDGVPPDKVFLTNAYIGLPDLAKDTAPFPTTPEFDRRCGRLLALEIELFCPRCVVCLGTRAAKMLARITDGLDAWRPWPGYQALASRAALVIPTGQLGDARFAAVAVQHPSAVISTEARLADSRLIAYAAGVLTRQEQIEQPPAGAPNL
jgi:Uracil DNA glycosylase superfamily